MVGKLIPTALGVEFVHPFLYLLVGKVQMRRECGVVVIFQPTPNDKDESEDGIKGGGVGVVGSVIFQELVDQCHGLVPIEVFFLTIDGEGGGMKDEIEDVHVTGLVGDVVALLVFLFKETGKGVELLQVYLAVTVFCIEDIDGDEVVEGIVDTDIGRDVFISQSLNIQVLQNRQLLLELFFFHRKIGN